MKKSAEYYHYCSLQLNILGVKCMLFFCPTEGKEKKHDLLYMTDIIPNLRSVSWVCVTVCFRCWTNCVRSWPWFQLSSLVLFRSFCGLGLLSNDYPGSPYPKKHLQGTLTSRKICTEFPLDTWAHFIYREDLFSQFVHQLGVSIYSSYSTQKVCVCGLSFFLIVNE